MAMNENIGAITYDTFPVVLEGIESQARSGQISSSQAERAIQVAFQLAELRGQRAQRDAEYTQTVNALAEAYHDRVSPMQTTPTVRRDSK